MKKFISLLTVAIIAFVAMAAQAKTVTVTINDPEGASVIDTSITYMPITFTNGTATVELGSQGGLQVSTNRGYDVTSITVNGTPVGGNYISTDQMPDGCTVAIIVEKPKDKKVTVTIDNPDAITVINTSGYSSNLTFTKDVLTITTDVQGTAGLQIMASSGYEIANITINGETYAKDSTSSTYINASSMPDNCVIVITTKEKEATIIYVEGNPAQVSLRVDYETTYDATNSYEGRWTISTMNSSPTMEITAASGYVISSVMQVTPDGTNNELLPSYSKNTSNAYIYLGGVKTGSTIVITSGTLDELRTAHVSVAIMEDGSADQIVVKRGYETIPADSFDDIAVIPGTEVLTIESATAAPLYKILVNESEKQPGYDGSYRFDGLSNGDIIKVWTNFPAEDCPVHISFTNADSQNALKQLVANGINVSAEEWQAEDYTVPAGTKLGFTFDNYNYNISSVTVNGEYQSTYGFEYLVTKETSIVIDAQKLKGYTVTVFYIPGTIKIYTGNGSEPIELPADADEVTFEVSPSNNNLRFEAEEGYVITDIEDNYGETYKYGYVYVSKDMEIYVLTEKFERDQQAVVYLQDTYWSGAEMILSVSNYSIMQNVTLKKGYNFVEYSTLDRPFGFNCYPLADIYLNGVKIYSQGGAYVETNNFNSGDVIKIFQENASVETYSLNISIASNVAVNILADYVTPIEGPVASVFGPTDIEFTPATRAAELPFIVKVNGTEIAPDNDGKVIAHINSDATIAVEANPASSITEINADSNDTAIYNLQGVRVSNPCKGIFIKNGKKVIL